MKTQNRLSIQACSKCDSDTIVSILHDAFTPVAQEFGLTNANCPNHTSFIRRENIEWEFSNESKYFIGSINGSFEIGCISIKVDPGGEA